MRTKQLYPGINNSQKVRVILNGVGIYTTVSQVQDMFMNIDHRVIVDYALCELSRESHIRGIASRRNGIDFQVDLL